jgi:hypothetical protein
MDGVNEVAGALESLTGGMGGIAVLVAGIGTLSMAVVEAVKSMLPLRAYFHRGEIQRWLKGEHASTDARLMGVGFDDLPSAIDSDAALNELLRLAIGGTSYQTALFEQAPEKMFGQIQAAANVAMDFPTIAPNLYEFLTHEAGSEKVGSRRATLKAQEAGGTSDQEVWSRFTAAMHAGEIDPKDPDPAKKKEYLDGNQARQRLDNLVRRRLDALQSRVTYRWGRYNQFAAFFTAVGFSIAALVQVPKLGAFSIAVLAVAAGFLAPPAKDLAAALGNIRYR